MRKLFVTIGMIAALIAPVAATANDLHNGVGTTCGANQGVTWHFIQNQVSGGTASTSIITAVFDLPGGGTLTFSGPADKLTKGGVLHWTFTTAAASLKSASTNVTSPGNFNLSSWTCADTKKDPPPKK
jgi:hypothetical protein